MNDASAPATPTAEHSHRWNLRAVKWLVLAVTLAGVGWQCQTAYREFVATSNGVQIDVSWWLAGAGWYWLGWSLQSTPWQTTLASFGGPPASSRTFGAYLAGHLGKYIPGKAMVFAIRGSLLAPETPLAATFVGTLYETLTTMAAGAALSAVVLWRCFPETALAVRLGAAGIACGLLVGLSPPIFRSVVGFGLRKIRQDRFLGRGPSFGRWAVAFGGALLAWVCISTGYACTVRAVEPTSTLPALAALGLAAAPLAVVGGFLSMIPGQLGAREWVLVALAAPALGSDLKAVVAAGLFRATTLAVEVPVGFACYAWCARFGRRSAP